MRPIHDNDIYITFSDGSKLPSRKFIKNEWTMYDSMSEKRFVEYKNGCVFCECEWNLLGNNELEFIQRMNRDRDGNFYTTRRVSKLSAEKYRWWEEMLAEESRMAI